MIIPLDPDDQDVATRVVEIQRAAYQVEADLIGFDGIPQLTESVDEVRLRTSMQWRGAVHDGELVGIIAWEESADEIDIDRLAIDPNAARQGHGRRLIQSVPSDRVTLVATGAKNLPALSLYESMGFEHIGKTELAPGVFLAHLRRG